MVGNELERPDSTPAHVLPQPPPAAPRVNSLKGAAKAFPRPSHSVKSPTGGYDKFLDSGLGDSSATWLPSLMQGAGYSSYFVGKFINGWVRGRRGAHAEAGGGVVDGRLGGVRAGGVGSWCERNRGAGHGRGRCWRRGAAA